MSNTIDKKKLITYLSKVAEQHNRQTTDTESENAPDANKNTDMCMKCHEMSMHAAKNQFAEMLVAKINMGDLDWKKETDCGVNNAAK